MKLVLGADLAVGDVIEAWWGRQMIVALRTYEGLPEVFVDGAQTAEFADGMCMTIDNAERYERVRRAR